MKKSRIAIGAALMTAMAVASPATGAPPPLRIPAPARRVAPLVLGKRRETDADAIAAAAAKRARKNAKRKSEAGGQ